MLESSAVAVAVAVRVRAVWPQAPPRLRLGMAAALALSWRWAWRSKMLVGKTVCGDWIEDFVRKVLMVKLAQVDMGKGDRMGER
jgi:hypothetical protein